MLDAAVLAFPRLVLGLLGFEAPLWMDAGAADATGGGSAMVCGRPARAGYGQGELPQALRVDLRLGVGHSRAVAGHPDP